MSAVSIVGLILSVIAFPLGSVWVLAARRRRVMEDQLLRAYGSGHSRLTNPNAYVLRKSYGSLYARYKPGLWFWFAVVFAKKALLVFVAVATNLNATVQSSSLLLILIIHFSLHVKCAPLMSVDNRLGVVRSHLLSVSSDKTSAFLRQRMVEVEAGSRGGSAAKKTHKVIGGGGRRAAPPGSTGG